MGLEVLQGLGRGPGDLGLEAAGLEWPRGLWRISLQTLKKRRVFSGSVHKARLQRPNWQLENRNERHLHLPYFLPRNRGSAAAGSKATGSTQCAELIEDEPIRNAVKGENHRAAF